MAPQSVSAILNGIAAQVPVALSLFSAVVTVGALAVCALILLVSRLHR